MVLSAARNAAAPLIRHDELKFLQLADPPFHHSAELLDLVLGVASRAKRVANLLRRKPSQQIPHPPGIFA